MKGLIVCPLTTMCWLATHSIEAMQTQNHTHQHLLKNVSLPTTD